MPKIKNAIMTVKKAEASICVSRRGSALGQQILADMAMAMVKAKLSAQKPNGLFNKDSGFRPVKKPNMIKLKNKYHTTPSRQARLEKTQRF